MFNCTNRSCRLYCVFHDSGAGGGVIWRLQDIPWATSKVQGAPQCALPRDKKKKTRVVHSKLISSINASLGWSPNVFFWPPATPLPRWNKLTLTAFNSHLCDTNATSVRGVKTGLVSAITTSGIAENPRAPLQAKGWGPRWQCSLQNHINMSTCCKKNLDNKNSRSLRTEVNLHENAF